MGNWSKCACVVTKRFFLTRWFVARFFSPTCAGLQKSALCAGVFATLTKMADRVGNQNEDLSLDLRAFTTETDRGSKFWNTSVVEMKFSVERRWIKSVRKAKKKPDYGMAKMDRQREEVIGNKLELAGPLIDSYLKEIGRAIGSKLSRSKATGLVNPVVLFFPWPVFRHVLTLVRGYSGDVVVTSERARISITITEMNSLVKLLSPSRFSGENFIAHRHFRKVPSKSWKKLLSVFDGRSLVVVTRNTPFKIDYQMRAEKVTVTFYVQRYNTDNFPVATSLQALMNRLEK